MNALISLSKIITKYNSFSEINKQRVCFSLSNIKKHVDNVGFSNKWYSKIIGMISVNSENVQPKSTKYIVVQPY